MSKHRRKDNKTVAYTKDKTLCSHVKLYSWIFYNDGGNIIVNICWILATCQENMVYECLTYIMSFDSPNSSMK